MQIQIPKLARTIPGRSKADITVDAWAPHAEAEKTNRYKIKLHQCPYGFELLLYKNKRRMSKQITIYTRIKTAPPPAGSTHIPYTSHELATPTVQLTKIGLTAQKQKTRSINENSTDRINTCRTSASPKRRYMRRQSSVAVLVFQYTVTSSARADVAKQRHIRVGDGRRHSRVGVHCGSAWSHSTSRSSTMSS